jgi:hypothetical protein
MCNFPVTLGGGSTMTNDPSGLISPFAVNSGLKNPCSSHQEYHADSTAIGLYALYCGSSNGLSPGRCQNNDDLLKVEQSTHVSSLPSEYLQHRAVAQLPRPFQRPWLSSPYSYWKWVQWQKWQLWLSFVRTSIVSGVSLLLLQLQNQRVINWFINCLGATRFQDVSVRSLALLPFPSSAVASPVPILLPASFPEACCPIVLDSAAFVRAVFVSFETGGGGPEIGPVFSPTRRDN